MSRYGGGSDYSPRAPERWDRSRFEAASRREAAPVMERDTYEEAEYYRRTRERTPPPRQREDDRYVMREEERYDYRPRREYYYKEPERDPYEGALVHRPRESRPPPRDERELEIDISRREYDRYEPRRSEGRPTFVRRQSSLDTHDRRPLPRYGDRPTEEVVFMETQGRRRSSVRHDDYEEVKVADPGYYGDDGYRGYREREIERFRRRRSPSPSSEGTAEAEEIVEEKEEIVEKEFPRKGKTKMPARLVNKKAIIQLGYPFEEEGETIIIQKALGKEHIDEVITLSKEMNKTETVVEEKKTTYVFERQSPSPEPEGKIIEKKTEIIRDGSEAGEMSRSVREWDQMSMSKKSSKSKVRSPSPSESLSTHHSHHTRRRSSHHSHRARSHSTGVSPHRAIILEERDESASFHAGIGALDRAGAEIYKAKEVEKESEGALVVKEHRRRRSKSISKEIQLLQAERKALQLEREAELLRGSTTGGEIVIARPREETVEVVKDKKAPDPRIIRAMLATLT